MPAKNLKRASLIGALFFCPPVIPSEPSDCQPPEFTDTYRVSAVFDGDTLQLETGDKVRLVGINTPETAKDNAPAEPFADVARDTVRKLLRKTDRKINLVRGLESRDRYGRMLAHVFLPGHGNLSTYLLERGLGSYIAIPPNLRYLGCYRQAEQRARQLGKGRWGKRGLGIISVQELNNNAGGFEHIKGKVTRIGEGKKNIWLNLGRYLAIRIPRKDLVYFEDRHPDLLLNRSIEARGWIYYRKSQRRMKIQHPAMLRVLD